MTTTSTTTSPRFLTVADPKVFIGLLIGGAVPFLFSSMLIRAVGRAAFYIVKECRMQFNDPAIMAGTKKPNYGRVVDICTSTAQSELIGPALLAVLGPILVGFLLGPYALGGFLAGMIVSGVMLGVFMANAGGAWDNAKKMIEDEPRTGRNRQGLREAQGGRHRRYGGRSAEGHRRPGHQPAGQGDEHGGHAHAHQRGAGLQHGGRQEFAARRIGAGGLDRRDDCHRLGALDRLGDKEVEHRDGRACGRLSARWRAATRRATDAGG